MTDLPQVPDYAVTQFQPRRHRYCVCVFVLNEGPRITAQLERMKPYVDYVDIIIADGGSTDDALAAHRLAGGGVSALLVKRGAGALGAQMRMAFYHALQEGYDGVITMDGNNKDDPSAIPHFITALDAGMDHVQGSRFISGGVAENTPLSRLLGIKLLHAPLVSLAAGFHYTDTTNGFRAYSRRLLEDPRVAPFRGVFSHYELHYYLAIRAARLGLRLTEIPVTRVYPKNGKTPTKISSVKGNFRIIKTLIKACLNKYDPNDQLHRIANGS